MNVNPFKELRTRTDLSQYELARRIGISKHAILRLEQGMYEDALPTVVTYWVANANVSRDELLSDYQEFQIQTRESNARIFGDLTLAGNPLNEHPITYLRTKNNLNLTEVAKRLCLSQSTLFYFERNPIVQGIVPVQLIRALHDADYTSLETQSLENAYAIFRAYKLKQQNVRMSPRDELASPPVGNQVTSPPVGIPLADDAS